MNMIVALVRPFKRRWAAWAGRLWAGVIFSAAVLEAAGFLYPPVPTLSDILVRAIRKLGRVWGRVAVLSVLAFLFHHFVVAPFREE